MTPKVRAARGQAAEHIAAAFLRQQGLELLHANYRCRFGEVDLVMQDGAELVFVEVRLRSPGRFGDAADSITPAKQNRLRAAASHYLAACGNRPCRFDAILMDAPEADRIRWLKHAFQ